MLHATRVRRTQGRSQVTWFSNPVEPLLQPQNPDPGPRPRPLPECPPLAHLGTQEYGGQYNQARKVLDLP